MRFFYSFAIILFLFFNYSCQKQQDHWRPLLAEEGLDNFEILNGTATYERKGNTIIGTTKFGTPNTFLATKTKYSDFELRFEVLLTEGLNSGVQIRSTSDPAIMKGRVHGYQVEIEDSDRGWAGGIYDEARRGWLNPLEWNPGGRKAFKKGEWNHYHIVAKADTIRTWVNGFPCSFLIDDMTSNGLIGFQVHSIGDSTQANQSIEWRNIEIKTTNVGAEIADVDLINFPMIQMTKALVNETDEFIIENGYRISQVAGEPQISNPVDAQIDEKGNFWVVELPGYMRDIDGNDENLPDGKIVVLSDIDSDGNVDRRVVFKEELVAPRTICLVYNGLLYNSGKTLFFEDFDIGETTIVDSSYVYGGNIEHQSNGLFLNIDNWIYSAKSKYRYRRVKGEWKKERTSVRGQWGLSADKDGRLVYNNNSNGLQGDRVIPNTLESNDFLKIDNCLQNQFSTDNRVYPYQAVSLNRGYQNGVLDTEGKLKNMTSSCSPLIMEGKVGFNGQAFTCIPEVNGIKKYVRNSKLPFSQDYKHALKGKEFLLSKKESFRPVNLFAHPDDGIFVVDLRKGIIQHSAYMTHYLRELVLEKKLNEIKDKGRLYWIFKEAGEKKVNYKAWDKKASKSEIVQFLGSVSMKKRRLAQKHIISNPHPDWKSLVSNALQEFCIKKLEYGVIHSLWTLEGIDALTKDHLTIANARNSEVISYHILNLFKNNTELMTPEVVKSIAAKKSTELDLQLCYLIPVEKPYETILNNLIRKYENKTEYCEALLSHLPMDIFSSKANPNSKLMQAWTAVNTNIKENNSVGPNSDVAGWVDRRTVGFEAYSQYCGSCHGMDGRGQDNLAPPILHSSYVEGDNGKLAAIILQGLQGPIHVNDKLYEMNLAMPGLKQNDDLDDATIAGIIAFVNNAFSKKGDNVSPERVAEIRAKLSDRSEMLTESEVFDENAW